MGHWLSRRSEALIDAVVVFVFLNLLGPLALAALLYLTSSVTGTFALLFAALWIVTSIIKKMSVWEWYTPALLIKS